MNLTLPLCYSVYLIAYANASMPAVINGAGMRQWTTIGIPSQHELSLDQPCAPTLAFPDGRHYWLVFSTSTNTTWVPPTRWYIGPVDRDGDHAVTSADFFDFLRAWMNQAASSDYDGNGVYDSRDFLAFNQDWAEFNLRQ